MNNRINELAELFDLMPAWSDRYNYIIDLGNALPPMPVAFKTPENRISCNSTLYFYAYYTAGICHIEAEANTPIPQGLAALLHSVFNDCTRPEITKNLPRLAEFLNRSGLPDNLTTARRAALLEMIKKIAKQ